MNVCRFERKISGEKRHINRRQNTKQHKQFSPLTPLGRGQSPSWAARLKIDDRQITHLICARLKYDLYDFFRGVLGLLPVLSLV